MKIGVLVSGNGSNLEAIIKAIETKKINDVEIVVVVSSKENAYALERAKKACIHNEVLVRNSCISQKEFDSKMSEILNNYKVDLVVMAGFLTIMGKDFIQNFNGKIINIHPSLIPAFSGLGFYGMKVHKAAIERGVKISGATVHYVNEIPDGGIIIAQKAVRVEDGDTPETLQKRVIEEAEWKILPEAIEKIARLWKKEKDKI